MTRGVRAALFLCAAAGTLAAGPARAEDPAEPQDLSGLSIEQLAQIEVRSASKREQPLSSVPTALYVITSDDILRSPATSLPELLREAPNLQVQRIDAQEYAITARGFSGYDTANKLLVEIDGRSVYSTFHSGVFWELHNPVLEDIRQVEVISGPGGTLYGANAVNGVIAVTTRDAADTLGLLARGTAGAREQDAVLRYGFRLGDRTAVRVYGNWFNRDGLPGGTAADYDDAFRGWQAGFRGDVAGSANRLTLQGDIFGQGYRLVKGDGAWGKNLLARWSHDLGAASSVQLQAYYDDYRRQFILVRDSLETFDASAQINRRLGAHQLVAGLGMRTTRDKFINNLNIFKLVPDSMRLWFFNGFVQDEMALGHGASLIAGVKLERSSFTGFDILPNLRLAWQPNARNLLWAAVSRAIRTPSRTDRDLYALPILAPAPRFASEKLVAIEAGYRGQPTPTTTLSVSGYVNLYDDIRTTELTNGGLPIQLRNGLAGQTYGVEIWATQQVAPWWRVKAGANLMAKDFHAKPGVVDIAALGSLGSDPSYQLQLRSQFDPTPSLTIDVALRAVDALRNPAIPAYAEADARIGWRVRNAVELYVAGQNLLHARHRESNDTDQAQAVARTVEGGVRLRF
ncbi:MAG: TonB-dependent receptor [Alphaproteobacteria bacterium]|nr:TonB-dependent receptor [Alphaproteobacteria bacterium]